MFPPPVIEIGWVKDEPVPEVAATSDAVVTDESVVGNALVVLP